MADRETIAALATASGKSALAVIRVSGRDSHSVVGHCLREQERYCRLEARTLKLFTFLDPTSRVPQDTVTVVRYLGPVSYTGEDMVEIICHGGQMVVEQLLRSLLAAGARLARNGEFTRRALLNGKVDLLEAEAVDALVNSSSGIQQQAALRATRGAFSQVLSEVRERLGVLMSEVEARIEFPDEDDIGNAGSGEELRAKVSELSRWIAAQLKLRANLKRLDQGLVIAIMGVPNAGKSSLFNLLLGQERSLVHWQCGTTRDWVSERAVMAGVQVRLIDTAGIGPAGNEVEAMGIKRSWEHAEQAEIVVWVTQADTALASAEQELLRRRGSGRVVCVVNKTDLGFQGDKSSLCRARGMPYVEVSLKTGAGTGRIAELIEEAVRAEAPAQGEECIVLNERQETCLKEADGDLGAAVDDWSRGMEIVAQHMREAATALAEFVGATTSEEVLDRVFSAFCIGK